MNVVRIAQDSLPKLTDAIGDILGKSIHEDWPCADYKERVMSGLSAGALSLWRIEDNGRVRGMIITSLYIDKFTRVRMLLVYLMYFFGEYTKSDVAAAVDALTVYTKQKQCRSVVTLSTLKEV